MEWVSVLALIVICFLAGMDSVMDSFQFHQPLVCCSLIGLATGCLAEGVLLGGYLQLIAIGWANIGASVAPDVCLASIISSLLMVKGIHGQITSIYVIAFSIAVAIPLSLIGLALTKFCRNQAVGLVHKMDETYEIETYHTMGILMQGLRGLVPALILLLIPDGIVQSGLEMIPESIFVGCLLGAGVAGVVGFGIVSNVLSDKKSWPMFLIGYGLACVSNLPISILCMIGFGIVWIVMTTSKNEPKDSDESSDPLGDILNDYE